MSTYGDIQGQVSRNCGNRTDADSLATIYSNFKMVQKTLARAHPFRELEAVASPSFVSGTATYSFSTLTLTRVRKIYYPITFVYSSQTRSIPYYTTYAWNREVAPFIPNAIEGRPWAMVEWSKSLEFYYIPDDTYLMTISFLQYPTEPATSIDTTFAVIYEDVDDVLILMTSYLTWLSFEEWEIARVYKKYAQEALHDYGIEDLIPKNFDASPNTGGTRANTRDQFWTNPFTNEMP